MSDASIFFQQVITRKLFAFAGASILIYDYLLTLSSEVAHIWNEPWTLVKSLFLINRYGNLIGQTFIMLEEAGFLGHGSRNFCIGFQLYSSFFTAFSGDSIRLFVVIRTCAVLRFRPRVALVVNTFFVIWGILSTVMSITHLMQHTDVIQYELLGGFDICFIPLPPQLHTWAMWFLPLVLDASMLAIVCFTLYWSSGRDSNITTSDLTNLLVRDGCLFYLATLFNVLFSMACWSVFAEDPRNFLQTLITYPILSVMGQRLVLNLRGYRTRPDTRISRILNRPTLHEESSYQSAVAVELDEVAIDRMSRRRSQFSFSLGRNRPAFK